MKRSEAVSRIQRRLGFRKDLGAPILDELMIAQEKFERGVPLPVGAGGTFLPWFLRTEVTSITTLVNEERVPLPPDFLREYEEDALWWFNPAADPTINQNAWQPLLKDDIQYNRRQYGGDDPTVLQPGPIAYAFDGNYFRIFPTPQDTWQLKMIYYARDAILDAGLDTENKWLKNASEVLIGEAGFQIAATARDADRMAYFKAIRDEGTASLYVYTEAQQHENRTYRMGRED
jgi:hypothetical protein